jgi:UrcA family protein
MNTLTASTGLSLIATAILGAATFSAVAADTSSKPISVIVRFSDLDISSQAGARVLYERIRAAAENGCSYYWFKSDADEVRCVHDAIASAVTKVDRFTLFAVYNVKNKTPLPTALASQSR